MVLTDLFAQDGCYGLLLHCILLWYLQRGLWFPPAIHSRTPPPGHPVSSLTGEDKDPAESEALHVASGLTSCHQALGDGEMMASLDVHVRVPERTVHPSICTRVCECVGHCRNTGGAWNCFQLKAEAPTTKALAGGVVTRRISFFFGLCDLPFLRFTFKALLAGRSPQLRISDGKKERCPPPLLSSPLFPSSKKKTEMRKNSPHARLTCHG